MKTKKENGEARRTFLKGLFTGGVGLLAAGKLKADTTGVDKIKLLTPDGKLVEVDKSKIEGNSQFASNKDVKEWMKKPKS